MVLRNATAIVIALLVLFLGVRPLAKALMKKRDDAGAGPRLAAGHPGTRYRDLGRLASAERLSAAE